MKKTNSMRVAIVMLALTLITSCFAGGTFAKYTTSASGGDSARVAMFGVEIKTGISKFSNAYETEDGTYKGEFSVKSADEKNVVAPGTKGTIDLFTISGNPEVAVKVDAVMDETNEIYLRSKETKTVFRVITEKWEEEMFIMDMMGGPPTPIPIPEPGTTEFEEALEAHPNLFESVDEKDEYIPIKLTLKKDGAAVVTDGTLDDVKDYINTEISGVYGPNELAENIGGTYTLEWKWDFNGNDTYDTLLGNLMAGTANVDDSFEYNLTEAFNFSITVTQID